MSNLKLFINFKYIIIEGFRNKVKERKIKEKSQRKICHIFAPLLCKMTL